MRKGTEMRIIIFLFCALLTLMSAQDGSCRGFGMAFSSEDDMCGPTLLKPISEKITIPRDGSLEFEWEIGYIVKTNYYWFRLYKGYGTTEDNLIAEKRIPNDEFKLYLPASQFEDGQVYTWVLVQVFNSGRKSDKSFASFKIYKQ